MLKIPVAEFPTFVRRAVATFGTPATGGEARVISVTTRFGCPQADEAERATIDKKTELERRISVPQIPGPGAGRAFARVSVLGN
jgi:hypothetical protein